MPKLIPSSKITRWFCILGILAVFVGAIGGVLAWQMNKTIYDEGFQFGKRDEWPHIHIPRSDQQSAYDVKFAETIDRYPDLKPQWRSVPDEANGFLQLLNLYEYLIGANGADVEYRVILSEELRRELSVRISEEQFGDGERFSKLIIELERIAELEERSCAGVNPHRLLFYPSATILNFTDILLYDAKLAAELGDKEKALARVRTAVQIGKHFSHIETQALIGITIAILCEQNVLDTIFSDILPKLELNQEEYKEWRAVITADHVDLLPKQVSMGEFNIATPVLALPICEKVWLFQLTGTDNVYDAIAETHLELMSVSSGGYQNCLETHKIAESSYISRRLVQILHVGLPGYLKSVARATARFRYYDAALAQLVGEDLNHLSSMLISRLYQCQIIH